MITEQDIKYHNTVIITKEQNKSKKVFKTETETKF